ncbi:MAG: hypothetical protein LJF04_14180 [Gemmatimonadetes bacterium]|nr:hypothetical protein [Gemmatimonadota bacterium]
MTRRLRGTVGRLRYPGLLLLVGVMVGLAGAQSAGAQTTQRLLQDRRDEYDAAKADFLSAQNAYRVVERQFADALQGLQRARAAGDDAAIDQGLRLAQDRAGPLQAGEQRLDRTKAALDSARRALIEIIGVRQAELVAQMDAAASSQQRNDLNALFQDLNRQLMGLETEAGDALRPQPVVLSDVQADPRDGPMEVLGKAQLLEQLAAQADTAIQDVDRQIKDLTARQRRQLQMNDLVAGLERFDDTRLPVVTSAPPSGRAPAADSTGAGPRPLTLQERIQALQDYRKQLEAYRDQALIRAKEFRRKLGSVA